MSETLTPLERRVYHYLLDFLAENTYQPSIRDICRRFKIKSTKSAADILQSLAEKGYIQRDGSRSRGVRLIGFQSIGGSQPIPLYSRINATEPRLAPENRERFIVMDRSFVPADDAFFVRADDDAMAERGIYEGDLVLVNPSARARDTNDVIVARVGERCLVRLLAHRGASVSLIPAAADEREIVLGPDDDFEILGVVATILRAVQDVLPWEGEVYTATAAADLQEI
ncbi:MAG TPA: transcriptional repressor LexA [Gemmatimonadaceae bacterium]